MNTLTFDIDTIKYVESKITLISLLNNYHFNFVKEKNASGRYINYQTSLIENILLEIPLPKFYLHEFKDYKVYPIDKIGNNTLRALKNFIEGDFRLQNLEYLPYNNLTFQDLPPDIQRKIYWKKVDIVTFSQWTPAPILYNLYKKVSGENIEFQFYYFDVLEDYLKYFKMVEDYTPKELLTFIALYLNKEYQKEDIKAFVLSTLYNHPLQSIDNLTLEIIKNHLQTIALKSNTKNKITAILIYIELYKKYNFVDEKIFLKYLEDFSYPQSTNFIRQYSNIKRKIHDTNNNS